MKKKILLMITVLMLSLLLLTGCRYSISASPEINTDVVRISAPYEHSAPPDDSSMPFYGGWEEYDDDFDYDDDYYYGDHSYDYEYVLGMETSSAFGYIVIVVFGYVAPLVLIILSLVFYLKSNSKRRYAWFIMTGTGLAIALLSTLYMLLTM